MGFYGNENIEDETCRLPQSLDGCQFAANKVCLENTPTRYTGASAKVVAKEVANRSKDATELCSQAKEGDLPVLDIPLLGYSQCEKND
mmetsp:Transcript_5046/g.32116  ORF Transcript_5046/g.32116 Transcript_5046/m.32116 type:complete len:88 (-) Transcript_5046:6000-6263(-)